MLHFACLSLQCVSNYGEQNCISYQLEFRSFKHIENKDEVQESNRTLRNSKERDKVKIVLRIIKSKVNKEQRQYDGLTY